MVLKKNEFFCGCKIFCVNDHLAGNCPTSRKNGRDRNGNSRKTAKGGVGELPIDIPRDRQCSFEPQLIPKHQTRWTGCDDKILPLYARGMTVRGTGAARSKVAYLAPEAIETVLPKATVPLCREHVVRYSLNCVSWKLRMGAATDLRAICTAATADEALLKLFCLAMQNISKKWTMSIRGWKAALKHFTSQFEKRMPQH
ncbi:MAG: transposase [Gallionella sp.]|nr:transposase [Gallionella sp.]